MRSITEAITTKHWRERFMKCIPIFCAAHAAAFHGTCSPAAKAARGMPAALIIARKQARQRARRALLWQRPLALARAACGSFIIGGRAARLRFAFHSLFPALPHTELAFSFAGPAQSALCAPTTGSLHAFAPYSALGPFATFHETPAASSLATFAQLN
jgi:hypothetical protein